MSRRRKKQVHVPQKKAEATKTLQGLTRIQDDASESRPHLKRGLDLGNPAELRLLHQFIDRYSSNEASSSRREDKRFIWEVVAVFVAGTLAVLTLLQAYYTRQTVIQQREQFILDRRPYIKVNVPCVKTYALSTKEEPCPPIEIGKPIMAVVEWKNIGKSPALQFRITRWVDFGPGSDKNYKESRPFPSNVGPGTSLPDETADTVAVSRTVFSDVQSISVNIADTKAWDGTYPIAVFGNIYFKDTAGRDYCNPYLFLLIKSGATLIASEDLDAKCKDPDML